MVSGKGTKKGKKSSKLVSLKNAPFLLKDGDIIGVKVCGIKLSYEEHVTSVM